MFYSGFVDVDKILDYREHREKFIKKGRGVTFRDAIVKMDQFIANPQVNKQKQNAYLSYIKFGSKISSLFYSYIIQTHLL